MSATVTETSGRRHLLPDLPLPVWMILITLGLLLGQGLDAEGVIAAFNTGWGRALGDFALILLPSFTLAAALDRQRIEAPPLMATGLSPFAAAGMVCPDTAYASLAPMTTQRRLSVAFGTYTGFKLLVPAGPLIVATGIGVDDRWLLATSAALFLPVFAVGQIYARRFEDRTAPETRSRTGLPILFLAPFGLLAGLLIVGAVFDDSAGPLPGFFLTPKGALIAAAVLALAMVPQDARRPCLESGVRRTGHLLTIIGAASAFSAALTSLVAVGDWFEGTSGSWALLGLFGLTALFKLLQGSSLSTFAAIGPMAAPIVAAADLPPVAAVLAICLGSFGAIAPNDSFFWLVRQSALPGTSDARATLILTGGAVLQALTGMVMVLGVYAVLA